MRNIEMQKSKVLIIVELVDYIPHSIFKKTIVKKTTGDITAVSFDSGEALLQKKTPFDTYIQVIEGKAEIFIDGKSKKLNSGESIIIPAHLSSSIKANVRFKMISTTIKSGYEEIRLEK